MGTPIATIRSAGRQLHPMVEVLTIEIHHELNRIPEATLTLLDGGAARREFAVSNLAFFEPGNWVEIALRREVGDDEQTVFRGLVVRHGVEARSEGSSLRVELKDAAFRLTRRRRSAVFSDLKDSDVIQQLLRAAGLDVGEIASTTARHHELIQCQASPWDFIVSRADVSGLVVKVARGEVSLKPMAPMGKPRATFAYGMAGIREFELELDGGAQWDRIESVGWDAVKRDATAPMAASDPQLRFGNLDAGAVARQLGGTTFRLLHPASLENAELQAWADARFARSRLALLRGRLVVDGRADLEPGDWIELTDVGERFNGRALLSAVIHRVDLGGWSTELRVGLSPEWFAREPNIADVPAGGLLPPIESLQLGRVAPHEDDPTGQYRIKLVLPAAAEDGVVWARFAQADAGRERGHVFWPEPGDEVVVGFVDGDPRQAIVLGSLFSKEQPPPDAAGPPSEDNKLRALVSRAGTRVVFDDKEGSITIETMQGSKLEIDDGQKAITVADEHGNRIVMNDSGITITSPKDFTIDAQGHVVIKGSTVDVQ